MARHRNKFWAPAFVALLAFTGWRCGNSNISNEDTNPPPRQHLISLDQGLRLIDRFARSGRLEVDKGLAPAASALVEPAAPAFTDYSAEAFRAVIEQPGASRLVIGLGVEPGGSISLVVGALDGADWLPRALSAGVQVSGSHAQSSVERARSSAQPQRQLQSRSDGRVVRFWTYDLAHIARFAEQPSLAVVRVSLGENAVGEPTAVMLGIDAEGEPLPDASDNGFPCPPYC